MDSWRLIKDWKQAGPFNIAADQILFSGKVPLGTPIVRFYTWDRLTLSLGQDQKVENEIDLAWCLDNRVPLMRRQTTGKAVLHGRDISYSIVGKVTHPKFYRGALPFYDRVAEGFMIFFKKLGVSVELNEPSKVPEISEHICFSEPSPFNITVNGKKIMYAAHRQQGPYFLHQGSIPVLNQVPQLSHIFHDETETLSDALTSLEKESALRNKTMSQIYNLLVASLREGFSSGFHVAHWSREEGEMLKELELKHKPILPI